MTTISYVFLLPLSFFFSLLYTFSLLFNFYNSNLHKTLDKYLFKLLIFNIIASFIFVLSQLISFSIPTYIHGANKPYRLDCKYRQIPVFPLGFSRISLYLFFIRRLYVTYNTTVYGYSKKTLTIFSVFTIISFTVVEIGFYLHYGIISKCQGSFIVNIVVALDFIVAVVLMYLFIVQLIKVISSLRSSDLNNYDTNLNRVKNVRKFSDGLKSNTKDNILNLLVIVIKTTILTTVAVLTTWILFGVYIVSSPRFSTFLFCVDVIINNICLVLTLKSSKNYYYYMCYICRKCCQCLVINKLDLEKEYREYIATNYNAKFGQNVKNLNETYESENEMKNNKSIEFVVDTTIGGISHNNSSNFKDNFEESTQL